MNLVFGEIKEGHCAWTKKENEEDKKKVTQWECKMAQMLWKIEWKFLKK